MHFHAQSIKCLDQENAHLKIEKWKNSDPESQHLFRPFVEETVNTDPKVDKAPLPAVEDENGKYRGNDGGDGARAIVDNNSYQQTLLWVHQTDWQKDLLVRYGNTISLIDATYKTTRYELALFFICVRTNVGYSVVGEFIVQSETTHNIGEALEVLRKWNPEWNPLYFISDYSEAELTAIEAVFPNAKTYLCDFHREQAWLRWCRDHTHGLTQEEADILLDLLRACAWAPPADGPDLAQHYKEAVSQLKLSQVWRNHPAVRQWLCTKWLPISKVTFQHIWAETIETFSFQFFRFLGNAKMCGHVQSTRLLTTSSHYLVTCT